MDSTNRKKTKVLALGVGNSGINIINYLIKEKELSDISGIEYCTLGSDKDILQTSLAPIKIQAGKKIMNGFGTGGDPEMGEKAVRESIDEIESVLKGVDILFIFTCMAGGMSTGGTLAVAEMAKKFNIKTICIVAKPFNFEGKVRRNRAEEGIKKLKNIADIVIPISNDNVIRDLNHDSKTNEIFNKIHSFMVQAAKSIYETVAIPGLIAVESGDIKSALQDVNSCYIGVGSASGINRAKNASMNAVNSLKTQISIKNVKGLIVNMSGGSDLVLRETSEAVRTISEEIPDDAKVVFGCIVDDDIKEEIKVTIVAGCCE